MKKHLLTAAATASILFTSFGGIVSAAGTIYTVQSGDTLWKISQANNVSVADLKAWNNLTSDSIYVNEKLSLTSPQNSINQTMYTVKSGDTLYTISKSFNTTIANLKSLNHLTSDTIYVGQELVINSSATSAPTVSKSQMIIDEAKKYMGVPYLWGGSTPAGFDCSGYVQYVYGKVGITIPRTTSTQWTGMKPISSANPGDLVFFNTSGSGVSHVGIYLGNNQFIHAGSSGVTIADMTTTYWKPKYLGARSAF